MKLWLGADFRRGPNLPALVCLHFESSKLVAKGNHEVTQLQAVHSCKRSIYIFSTHDSDYVYQRQ